MTLKELMDQLGFPSSMGDLDESLKWALAELHLRRTQPPEVVLVGNPAAGLTGEIDFSASF